MVEFRMQGLDKQSKSRVVAEYLDVPFGDKKRNEDTEFYSRFHPSNELGAADSVVCCLICLTDLQAATS
jgi:hypothetical protein